MSNSIMILRRVTFGILVLLFFVYSLAIIYLHIEYPDKDNYLFSIYTDSYGIIALLGGLLGLSFYRQWDGFRSIVGKALIFLSVGLLFQFLGQLSYAFFRYTYNIEVAYPSFGEIFYFGSIPIYIIGTWFISVAAGIKVKLRDTSAKIYSLLFITLMVAIGFAVSYGIFISTYDFSHPDPVVILLEIGYPIGQSVSLAFAILAFFLSRNILGGRMKSKVLLLLLALVVQYIADVFYTYDIYKETFYSGGPSDYLYILAYMIMGIGLFNLGVAPAKLTEAN